MVVTRLVRGRLGLAGASDAEGALPATGPLAETRPGVQQLDGVELVEHLVLLSRWSSSFRPLRLASVQARTATVSPIQTQLLLSLPGDFLGHIEIVEHLVRSFLWFCGGTHVPRRAQNRQVYRILTRLHSEIVILR